MKAQELRENDEFRDEQGTVVYRLITDAVRVGKMVRFRVQYVDDGGTAGWEYDYDQEVPHIRPNEES